MRYTFSSRRAIAPMMWVLLALMTGEMVVAHFLIVAFWSWTAAIVVTLLTLPAIAWFASGIASLHYLPTILDDGVLTLRVGRIKSFAVPVSQIAGLRHDFDAAAIKRPGVRNLALIAWPNVLVDLSPPLEGRRGPIHAIAHRFDDPSAFAAAIEGLRGRDD